MIRNNRNKGSVTRQTDFGCTPLSDIFRGELRSHLQREGEHSTDVIQPFFTLQLNIEVYFYLNKIVGEMFVTYFKYFSSAESCLGQGGFGNLSGP